MFDVPSIAVFCSESIECFPVIIIIIIIIIIGKQKVYCSDLSQAVPVCPSVKVKDEDLPELYINIQTYRTVNTFRLGYTHQSVNAVH
jgi:hypothetical protein